MGVRRGGGLGGEEGGGLGGEKGGGLGGVRNKGLTCCCMVSSFSDKAFCCSSS